MAGWIVVLAPLCVFQHPASGAATFPRLPAPVTLSITTWNVNSIRAHQSQVLEWVLHNQPHVLCLQETMVSAAGFPSRSFSDIGYESAVVGDGGRNGVAICSRVGLEDVQLGVAGAVGPFAEPRVVAATCAGVRVRSAYVPNGRRVGSASHVAKLAYFTFLQALASADLATGLPLVLAGDLNVAPTDLDVWDAHRYRKRNLTSPAERSGFDELLSAGLVDAVRVARPDDTLFTWWNRRGDFYTSDRGWRLDHVLVSDQLETGVLSAAVDRAERGAPGGSDHAPLTVVIDWPTETP